MQATLDVADLEHLTRGNTFSLPQEPQVTRILPSRLALNDERSLLGRHPGVAARRRRRGDRV